MKKKIYYILATALLLPLAGCDDSDKWTSGPEDTETGVMAYFVKPSKTSYVFDTTSTTAEAVIDVTVARSITTDAISIPLTLVTDSEGITVSGNAEFQAGQSETTVKVNYQGIPEGNQVSFTLEIPDNQFYTYGLGMPSVTYSVIKSKWNECADSVTYWYWDYDGNEVYPNTEGKMYQLEGTFQFKMTDFFGSGLDMEFICTTGDTTAFNPLINADYDTEKGGSLEQYSCWYIYDEENQTWPTWTPGNVEGYPEIWYAMVYGSDDYTDITMIDDAETLYGYLYLSTYINFSNGTGDYGDWYATFNLYENPF